MNGAHLKPLDRNDMKPKIGVQWNSMINTESYDSVMSTARKSKYDEEYNKTIIEMSPETFQDFLRSWRTIRDYSEKFAYTWNVK